MLSKLEKQYLECYKETNPATSFEDGTAEMRTTFEKTSDNIGDALLEILQNFTLVETAGLPFIMLNAEEGEVVSYMLTIMINEEIIRKLKAENVTKSTDITV